MSLATDGYLSLAILSLWYGVLLGIAELIGTPRTDDFYNQRPTSFSGMRGALHSFTLPPMILSVAPFFVLPAVGIAVLVSAGPSILTSGAISFSFELGFIIGVLVMVFLSVESFLPPAISYTHLSLSSNESLFSWVAVLSVLVSVVVCGIGVVVMEGVLLVVAVSFLPVPATVCMAGEWIAATEEGTLGGW